MNGKLWEITFLPAAANYFFFSLAYFAPKSYQITPSPSTTEMPLIFTAVKKKLKKVWLFEKSQEKKCIFGQH